MKELLIVIAFFSALVFSLILIAHNNRLGILLFFVSVGLFSIVLGKAAANREYIQ